MFEEDISTKAPRSFGAPLEVLLQRLYIIKEKNETWLSIAVRKHKENLEKMSFDMVIQIQILYKDLVSTVTLRVLCR